MILPERACSICGRPFVPRTTVQRMCPSTECRRTARRGYLQQYKTAHRDELLARKREWQREWRADPEHRAAEREQQRRAREQKG
jgi:hypothetical protein